MHSAWSGPNRLYLEISLVKINMHIQTLLQTYIIFSLHPVGNNQSKFICTCHCRAVNRKVQNVQCVSGDSDVCGIWTGSIMKVHPRYLLPTIHLLEWVPDTHSRGSRDYRHAISNCTHIRTLTHRNWFVQVAYYISNGPLTEPRQPTTMWWWSASFSALHWGEIYHTGKY